MPHLLVAGKLHPAGVHRILELENEGYSVTYIEDISEKSYSGLISDADALVIRTQPLSSETLNNASNLKVVSRHGVGYDAIDLQALNSRKIALTIVGDVNSVSVAEHAMMQLLACAKHVIRADQSVRDPSKWNWRNQLEQREISGSNLLIVGFGRAGQKLAQMAKAFNMNVRAYDPYIGTDKWPYKDVIRATDLYQGLLWADCLSLHVPKSEKPLINETAFAHMKPGMIIANTSRGGVIDEKALLNALNSGQVHAVGLDVFEQEPPSSQFELCNRDDTLLSPHIAGLTDKASERMALACIDNAIDYLNGTINPNLIVNEEALR
jgi:D-3-phosphoglycerate dehydrogenase